MRTILEWPIEVQEAILARCDVATQFQVKLLYLGNFFSIKISVTSTDANENLIPDPALKFRKLK